MSIARRCIIDGCDGIGHPHSNGKRYFLKGYCSKHYSKLKKYGDPNSKYEPIKKGECCAEGCVIERVGAQYCNKHRLRSSRYARLEPVSMHGENRSADPLYSLYRSIWRRCYNKNSKSYSNYGNRGIGMSETWLGVQGYTKFKGYILSTIGDRPSSKHSIDRIDNESGYEPGNVRWATAEVQVINRRTLSSNRSGVTGVYWRTESKSWESSIRVKGKLIVLVRTKDFTLAVQERKRAESVYHLPLMNGAQ